MEKLYVKHKKPEKCKTSYCQAGKLELQAQITRVVLKVKVRS